jgi:hypothetical protein
MYSVKLVKCWRVKNSINGGHTQFGATLAEASDLRTEEEFLDAISRMVRLRNIFPRHQTALMTRKPGEKEFTHVATI